MSADEARAVDQNGRQRVRAGYAAADCASELESLIAEVLRDGCAIKRAAELEGVTRQ